MLDDKKLNDSTKALNTDTEMQSKQTKIIKTESTGFIAKNRHKNGYKKLR